MRKRWLIVAGLGALVLLGLAALPYFFDAEAQRGILSSRLETSLGRKVKLGKIRLGVFPPALQVDEPEIAEALGFPGTAFSTAKKLRARVKLLPLLRGRLEVPWVELEDPSVQLVKNHQGDWNFASLGKAGAAAGPAGGPASRGAPLEIGQLRIVNGTLTVTDLQKRRPTVRFDRIFLMLKNFSREKPFDWEVSAHPPGPDGSSIRAQGQGGPLNPVNLAESPARGEAKFEEVDLAALAAFTDQPGLAGLFTGDSKFSSDGKAARVEGTYRVDRLRLSPKAGVAQAPLSGRFQLQYDSTVDRLNVQQFQLRSGNAMAHTRGHLRFGKNAAANLETKIQSAPLADVARFLPALGVTLPAGSSLSAGTLTGEAQFTGPLAQPSRRGHLEVRNARLSNYNVAGQLGSVIRLVGVDSGGKDTVIEEFRSAFVAERGYTTTSGLLLVIPGMNIAGEGGFSDAGNLNFQGTATLTRAGATVGALLQKVTGTSNVVPFLLTGTLEQPVFRPALGKIIAQQVQQQPGGGGSSSSPLLKGLGRLFGKK